MPTRKSAGKSPARATSKQNGSERTVGTTVSGPSHPKSATALASQAAGQQTLAEAMPFNSAKPAEYGVTSNSVTPKGAHYPRRWPGQVL